MTLSNFDSVISRRNTNSAKWDMIAEVYNVKNTEDILPMWVADMDFKAPQPVLAAMAARLEHGIFGYNIIDDATYNAVINWLQGRHNYAVTKEQILFRHGVIPALANVINALTKPDDTIIVSTPIYPPFKSVPQNTGRKVISCPLAEKNGQYTFDAQAFEETLKNNTVALYILCNPHNPGGMVWSPEVLREIVRLCAKYDVIILSDEIHSDLALDTHTHTPVASVAGDEIDRIITCMAPTKTFNLASVQSAFMIVHDKNKRDKIAKDYATTGQGSINAFAIEATKAAYTKGAQWLDELKAYISNNMDFAVEALNAMPNISATKSQGTYLLWVDYRATGLSEEDMMQRLLTKGKLALEPGSKYGDEGIGFLRINLACPLATVKDGMARFEQALQ